MSYSDTAPIVRPRTNWGSDLEIPAPGARETAAGAGKSRRAICCRAEGLDWVPRVVDVQDGIVVVLEVVALDGMLPVQMMLAPVSARSVVLLRQRDMGRKEDGWIPW